MSSSEVLALETYASPLILGISKGLRRQPVGGPRKGSDATKPGWDRALVNLNILMRDEMSQPFLTSWEIISHNTVVWTGDVNLDYKIALVLVLWAIIRTKL